MPPVHYSVAFDGKESDVTGLPDPVDAWEKKDDKITVTIPKIKPAKEGQVFGG